mgnify:CR=1 FL=1
MKRPILSIILIFLLSNSIVAQNSTQKKDSNYHYYEQCIYRPGDYESKNYRIPAIRVLDDGSLLVLNDKRKNNQGDLPEDIDILVRRSTDMGTTWSEPFTLAEGQGYKQGYGDPALVQCLNGDVVAVYCGGNGYWNSTLEDPQHTYMRKSKDHGVTWSEPVMLTEHLWGSNKTNPIGSQYKSSFFASGNGLVLTQGKHKGRILFVAAICSMDNRPDNFVAYSDDNGDTWKISDMAYKGGDEAKVVELKDGTILLSSRQNGARGYAISHDGGQTWDPQGRWEDLKSNACNGEIIRYDFPFLSFKKSILLHTIPNSMDRKDVSIYISRDNGKTWQFAKVIAPGPAAYSSLSILPDGRLVAYIERDTDGDGNYEMWFMRFSIEWLLSL